MGDLEVLARGEEEVVLHRICGSKCHTVHQGVDLAVSGFKFGEKLVDLGVVGHVAPESRRAWEIGDQVLGFLLQPFILISNDELRASGLQLLRDRPGNAPLVGDTEYYGGASL